MEKNMEEKVEKNRIEKNRIESVFQNMERHFCFQELL